jgi:hypothetical protein
MPVFPLAHKDVHPKPQLLKASGLPSTRTNLPFLAWQSNPHRIAEVPHPWQKVGMIFPSTSLFDASKANLSAFFNKLMSF